MNEASKTQISYYEDAYGLTIRIDAPTKTWLEYLKQYIYQLICEELHELEITSMKNVEINDDLKSLILRKAHGGKHQKLKESNENCFIWLQDTEELITLVGLINGLLHSDRPGHQYLTNENSRILIVLAYKESIRGKLHENTC